jgi:hypothetical protein
MPFAIADPLQSRCENNIVADASGRVKLSRCRFARARRLEIPADDAYRSFPSGREFFGQIRPHVPIAIAPHRIPHDQSY